jgi:hypothetical protein
MSETTLVDNKDLREKKKEERRKRILASGEKRLKFIAGDVDTPNLREGEKPSPISSIPTTSIDGLFLFRFITFISIRHGISRYSNPETIWKQLLFWPKSNYVFASIFGNFWKFQPTSFHQNMGFVYILDHFFVFFFFHWQKVLSSKTNVFIIWIYHFSAVEPTFDQYHTRCNTCHS